MCDYASLSGQNFKRITALFAVLALVVLVPSLRSSAQQRDPSRHNASAIAVAVSPLRHAEDLIRQGQIEQAKEIIDEQLKLHPGSVEGYNLLGIVYVNQKDGDQATEAFQQALRLAPNSTKTHNNLGNLYPYQHLFDYLNNRSALSLQQRTQLDVTELTDQIQKHPGQPQDLYLLAETYLKLGNLAAARETIAQLDQISADDYRTQTGIGVLLARYHLYDDAIQHFQTALHSSPESDDVKFDLANAYFRKGQYPSALDAAQTVSANGQQDDAFLSLLGDIEAHIGETGKATEIFRNAITRNPDNDQYYLSLTLAQLRGNDLNGAEQTLQKGLAIIPGSGKLVWGLGLISVLRGNSAQATERLERAVDLLPEWVGSYSTLGIFYYQTGQIEKAREVLNRFKGSNAGGLDVNRIEETLSKAPARPFTSGQSIPMDARRQVLQMAMLIADRSL